MEPSDNIQRLIEIMAALRDPEIGCPWDIEQTFASIAPYTIEEAYEVADAIEREDMADLRDELGDLLLQVVYHSRLAEEVAAFGFGDVVHSATSKMIKRHPHVFGDAERGDAAALSANWEAVKEAERRQKRDNDGASFLDDVPLALPGLTRAAKLQKRAASIGFDWSNHKPTLEKIREELAELESEIDATGPTESVEGELGDVLFSVVNLARHLKIDPERAMQGANSKFRRRFNTVERELAGVGKSLDDVALNKMDGAWESAKSGDDRTSS